MNIYSLQKGRSGCIAFTPVLNMQAGAKKLIISCGREVSDNMHARRENKDEKYAVLLFFVLCTNPGHEINLAVVVKIACVIG